MGASFCRDKYVLQFSALKQKMNQIVCSQCGVFLEQHDKYNKMKNFYYRPKEKQFASTNKNLRIITLAVLISKRREKLRSVMILKWEPTIF